MTKNLFDNPFYVVLLFFAVSLLNIIFTVHFIPIILAGLVFSVFIFLYEKDRYYSLFITILSFNIIESSQGMPFLSLSLLSFLIYIFVVPKIKKLFSIGELDRLLFVLIFYILYIFIYFILKGLSLSVFFKILLNIFVDFIIVGILF